MKKSLETLFLLGVFIVTFLVLSSQSVYCENPRTDSSVIATVSNSKRFKPQQSFLPGKDNIYVRLEDHEQNKDEKRRDKISLKISSAIGQDQEEILLYETGKNTGVFQNSKGITLSPGDKMRGDGSLQVAATGDVITVLYPGEDKIRVLATLNAAAATNHFSVVADPVQIAGKPFRVNVTAKDYQGNGLPKHRGSITIELVDASPGADKSIALSSLKFGAESGQESVIFINPDAGKFKLIAKDVRHNITGTSKELLFLPAKFRLVAQTPQVVGKEFSVIIEALNFNDVVTTNYDGSVVMEGKEGGKEVLLKKNIVFDQGVAETNVTSEQWGKKQLTVYDPRYPNRRSGGLNIFFKPDHFEVEISDPPKNRKKFYDDEIFKVKIVVFDYNGRKIPGYNGLVGFKQIENVDLLSSCDFGMPSSGECEFWASGITEKPFQIKVHDIGFPEAGGISEPIDIRPATLRVELIHLKGDRARLRLTVEDAQGRAITEDNSTMVTVSLIESILDGSAFIAGVKEKKVRGGIAELEIVDIQEETVTVVPDSKPYLEPRPLEVHF